VIQSKPIRFYLEISRFVDKPEFCDARIWRAAVRAVQGSRSMKPRLRLASVSVLQSAAVGGSVVGVVGPL